MFDELDDDEKDEAFNACLYGVDVGVLSGGSDINGQSLPKIDYAQGSALDRIGQLYGVLRGNGETDVEFRGKILEQAWIHLPPDVRVRTASTCSHEYVNVSFAHLQMACKHCGADK